MDSDHDTASKDDEVEESEFLKQSRLALEKLFATAREKDELNFALSLSSEFKPYTFTSAMEAQRAFHEYEEFLESKECRDKPIRIRIVLNFYCYVAESAGLWCIPMCMLGVVAGQKYNTDPFRYLVKRHKATGKNIAPNANKVMGALVEYSTELCLHDVATVFTNGFDGDLRNGVAHADYALSNEGIHVRGRHDLARLITWTELQRLVNDGVGLYHVLRDVVSHYQHFYETPRVVNGSMNDRDPVGCYLIHSDATTRTMSVSGGVGFTAETLLERLHAKNAPNRAS
jgi:hypothetical protein